MRSQCDNPELPLRFHCDFIVMSLRFHCDSIANLLRLHCDSIAITLCFHCESMATHCDSIVIHCDSIAIPLRLHCDSIAIPLRCHCDFIVSPSWVLPPPQPPYHPQGGVIGILEVGGVSPTGKSISVSVRVVRASGRGEAKLRGRARGISIGKLGLL